MSAFAELVCASNYSFLRGASHPAELVNTAATLGLAGIGLADRNTVAGVVRAHVALREAGERAREALLDAKRRLGKASGAGAELDADEEAACRPSLRLAVGARLVFADGTPDIVAYPATRRGWGRLTRLLTTGNMRAVKGDCIHFLTDLKAHLDDLLVIVMPASTAREQEAHPNPIPYDLGSGPCDDPGGRMPGGRMPGGRMPGGRMPGRGMAGRSPATSVDSPATPPPPPAPRLALVPPAAPRGLAEVLRHLAGAAPGCVWLAADMPRRGDDLRRLAHLKDIAAAAGVPLLATNDVLYAEAERRPLHDILTCIREGTTLHAAGRRLEANAERHLKPPQEMARLFRSCPEAIAETVKLLARIRFTLDDLSYEYPHEPVPAGWEPADWLEHLVHQAARARYGEMLPGKVSDLIAREMELIRAQRYAYYFLTVHDLVHFARTREPPILCQGRGSAANSIVCFLLGITSIDPATHDLLFSRFVSAERREPPDIDVDFEHERREEVMQYVYARYGRHRAGIAATVIHYRSRSAVREVAKALGLSDDIAARLAGTVWGSHSAELGAGTGAKRAAEAGLAPDNPEIVRLRAIMEQLLAVPFPRHLSQHVGGFVLTQDRLDETVPIHNAAMEGRSFIEWDKDDIDALRLMKVDVLALGMLTCIRKAFDLMRVNGLGEHTLEVDLASDDAAVYDMLCRGDSIGVFQVESRAQINMLPRLKPRSLYDLTVQVAIVRPGPIEGEMVHPYLRRRSGLEKVEYPSPAPPHDPDELKHLLGKTCGVPLFQEQAMKLAIKAAGFSDGEANQLRRAMATFRNVGTIQNFREKMVQGMTKRGYAQEFAERCFRQIEGFGSYGFPESHAMSFARLVYVSAWIKCHHPGVFACALLNSQPMGFYAPAQIVRDAREHGVEVRPIDVNASVWDNSLEDREDGPNAGPRTRFALRLGFRQMDGFRQDWAERIANARAQALFDDVEALARRAGLPQRALRLLADADALGSLGLRRREASWEVRRTPDGELPLFAAADARELGTEENMALPAMPASEEVATDYQTTRLSLKGHPMAFLRPIMRAEGIASCAETAAARNGARIRTGGIVLTRQRPGKGNAIFITLEDETGITNVLLWARLFETMRRPVMAARLMVVEGTVQRSRENVVHLMATNVVDRTPLLDRLMDEGLAPSAPVPRAGHPRNVRILPKSRDFH